MIPKKYIPPIKYLGGATLILLIFGWGIFPILSDNLLSEETQNEVLVNSIPFVMTFICIILMYALFMFIFAYRFNRKIPLRTFSAIENTIIAGIVIGVVALFQPFKLVSYQYGFLWLLGSTLTFIVWSHVIPKSAMSSRNLQPFSSQHQLVGAVMGLAVMAIVAGFFIYAARPAEPYGYSQRQWDRGLREEQKQEIIDDAESTFKSFTIPYFIFMSLFPAAAVFFASRELAFSFSSDSTGGESKQAVPLPNSG